MRSCSVLVIGGGTAGFMAAAHISKHFPDVSLVHAFDPLAPPIGVGEGTTPEFPHWISEIAGVPFSVVQADCCATIKRGISFEGWGFQADRFTHKFLPESRPACHIAASLLPEVLGKRIKATVKEQAVREIRRRGTYGGADVTFADDTRRLFDLVVDARGFPNVINVAEHQALTWIPTNCALVGQSRTLTHCEYTRAIARKHGWVFVIPLAHYTSYGYVFSMQDSTQAEVESDYFALLKDEGIEPPATTRVIRFPNFVSRSIFDGHVFKIGNCASFIEPLEATAIGVVGAQLHLLSFWLLDILNSELSSEASSARVNAINSVFFRHVLELSTFIGWHYHEGAPFDSAFWNTAKRCSRSMELQLDAGGYRAVWSDFCARVVDSLSDGTSSRWQTRSADDSMNDWRYGGFPLGSFFQMGTGLGVCSPARA